MRMQACKNKNGGFAHSVGVRGAEELAAHYEQWLSRIMNLGLKEKGLLSAAMEE